MKKILSLALVAVMLMALSLACFASGETFVKAADFNGSKYGEEIFSGIGRLEDIAGYVGEIGSNLYNLSAGGSGFCVKKDAYVWYEFEAPVDGVYTFAFEFVARTGAKRAMNVVIDPIDPTDDKEQTYILLDPCDDNNDHRFCVFTDELDAGKHTFYFCDATGFDDTNLKSCDTYSLHVYLTEEIVPEVVEDEKPEAAAAETKAPVTAAKTGDITLLAVAALLSSGIVLSRKRRH